MYGYLWSALRTASCFISGISRTPRSAPADCASICVGMMRAMAGARGPNLYVTWLEPNVSGVSQLRVAKYGPAELEDTQREIWWKRDEWVIHFFMLFAYFHGLLIFEHRWWS